MLPGRPMLNPAAFEAMARGFAERAASHEPSWVWVPASDDGPLLAPAAGFLRSAAILVPPPPVSGDDPVPSEAGLVDEIVDDDDAAAVRASPSAHRLELHIVDSVLTLYSTHRRPYWTTATGHAHQPRAALYELKAQGRSLPYVRRW